MRTAVGHGASGAFWANCVFTNWADTIWASLVSCLLNFIFLSKNIVCCKS